MKYLILILLLMGCASPQVARRAEVIKTVDGWIFSSSQEHFEMTAEEGDKKTSYSSMKPSMIEEIVKGVAEVGTSLGQVVMMDSILNKD